MPASGWLHGSWRTVTKILMTRPVCNCSCKDARISPSILLLLFSLESAKAYEKGSDKTIVKLPWHGREEFCRNYAIHIQIRSAKASEEDSDTAIVKLSSQRRQESWMNCVLNLITWTVEGHCVGSTTNIWSTFQLFSYELIRGSIPKASITTPTH